MRKTVTALAVAVLGAIPAPALAQGPDTSQLRAAVGRSEVLRHAQRLQAVGLANENHRLTASAGNFESLDYVINTLRGYGYNPTLLPVRQRQRAEHVVRAHAGRARAGLTDAEDLRAGPERRRGDDDVVAHR